MNPCPICQLSSRHAPEPSGSADRRDYICANCGAYALSGSAAAMIEKWRNEHPDLAARLSHMVWKMSASGTPPLITSQVLQDIEKRLPPIGLTDQADNLMLELSKASAAPGHAVQVLNTSEWIARAGARDVHSVRFLAESLMERGLLEEMPVNSGRSYRISFAGWQYIDELQRGQRESRKAFFASQWGDEQLDRIFANILVPAVQQTGFRLFRLDHDPKAGLIDDRMRVEIRTSRFLIADLTHGNSGAYWEAGYAEGLGRPVIFICEKSVYEASETHFDTNHHLTILWDEDDPEGTARNLKATIRATLPEDAILTDAD